MLQFFNIIVCEGEVQLFSIRANKQLYRFQWLTEFLQQELCVYCVY